MINSMLMCITKALLLVVVNIDMTRVLTAVLLQETQPQDSHGEPTVTSLYTNWLVYSSGCNGFVKGAT